MLPSLLLAGSLLSHTLAKDIFTIALPDLEALVRAGQVAGLEEVLAEEGALAVTGLPPRYARAVAALKVKAPSCLEQLDYPQFDLADGSHRRTFATETGAPSPYPACIREESASISAAMDSLDTVLSSLVSTIAGGKNLQWKTADDELMGNFSSTELKEHIHVYRPGPSIGSGGSGGFAAPLHTDRGLLLTLTPFQEHPLQLQDRAGRLLSTEQVGGDSLLVLVAAGLPDWLLQGTQAAGKFFPSPHAVPSLAGSLAARAVMARMRVVPLAARPWGAGRYRGDTFHQFFLSSGRPAAAELCPVAPPGHHSLQARAVRDLMESQCAQGKAWCWMNCLTVPHNCDAPSQCVNKDNKQCCTHNVTTNCESMDDSCTWKQECPTNPTDPTDPTDPPPFCIPGSGTDMYMKGFTVSGDAQDSCVILLFKSWVLNTRAKFGVACVGVVLLGLSIEAMLWLRRLLQSRKILLALRGPARRASIIFLFALNIGSGYLAMLVAMTYSVELFLCMVVGLVAGHAFFNSEAPVGESVDPCCASQAIPHPDEGTKEITPV